MLKHIINFNHFILPGIWKVGLFFGAILLCGWMVGNYRDKQYIKAKEKEKLHKIEELKDKKKDNLKAL